MKIIFEKMIFIFQSLNSRLILVWALEEIDWRMRVTSTDFDCNDRVEHLIQFLVDRIDFVESCLNLLNLWFDLIKEEEENKSRTISLNDEYSFTTTGSSQ